MAQEVSNSLSKAQVRWHDYQNENISSKRTENTLLYHAHSLEQFIKSYLDINSRFVKVTKEGDIMIKAKSVYFQSKVDFRGKFLARRNLL